MNLRDYLIINHGKLNYDNRIRVVSANGQLGDVVQINYSVAYGIKLGETKADDYLEDDTSVFIRWDNGGETYRKLDYLTDISVALD